MNLPAEIDKDKVIELLESSGCCWRCRLRFVGVPGTAESYREPEKKDDTSDSKPQEEEKEEDDLDARIVCVACLGILENKYQEIAAKNIIQKLKEKDYGSESFSCALQLPRVIQLREKSLQLFLAEKLELSETTLNAYVKRIQSVKDVWKILVAPKIARAVGKVPNLGPNASPLLIDYSFIHSKDEEECGAFLAKYKELIRSGIGERKALSSRKNIERILSVIGIKQFLECYETPPGRLRADRTFLDDVQVTHESIFIGGRYVKLSRELSQTPWFVNGVKKMETSVQEILCDLMMKKTRANSMKFLSSGREDVDVRTLNSGRPFAVELLDPRVTALGPEDLQDLVDRINASSTLAKISSSLKILSRDDLRVLKQGETEKTKIYRSLCVFREAPVDRDLIFRLNEVRDLDVVQKTPVRVLHRRPLANRSRRIHAIRVRWLTEAEKTRIGEVLGLSPDPGSDAAPGEKLESLEKLFVLDVKTQAGTYVKEFVHGDFGRTKPNVCELLGADVDIVSLDVTGIDLNFP